MSSHHTSSFTKEKTWSFFNCYINVRSAFKSDELKIDGSSSYYRSQKKDVFQTYKEDIFISYYIFNSQNVCYSHHKFIEIPEKSQGFEKIISRTSKWFISSTKKNSGIKFSKINLAKIKIYVISFQGIFYFGIFKAFANKSFCKLLSLHILASLRNYINQSFSSMPLMSEFTEAFSGEFCSLKVLLDSKKISQNVFDQLIPFVSYENFAIKFIYNHFTEIFMHLIQFEQFSMAPIHFKNIYIISLNCDDFKDKQYEILFDLKNAQSIKEEKKFYKFELMFKEILFQAKKLMKAYMDENQKKYISYNLTFRFCKLELTSTYPRYTFIIKFLPVLKGICILHVYSQKKLSRNSSEKEEALPKLLNEVDLLNALDLIKSRNVDFKYREPQKMSDIEHFMIEMFMTDKEENLFSTRQFAPKYLNFDLISEINYSQPKESYDVLVEALKKTLIQLEEGRTFESKDDEQKEDKDSLSEREKLLTDFNSDKFSASQQFKEFMLISKKDILSKMLNDNKGIFSFNEKTDFGETKESTEAVCNNSLSRDYTLTLSKVEKANDVSVTINQSKSISMIKPSGVKSLFQMRESENLDALLEDSDIITKKTRGEEILAKRRAERKEDKNWEKRMVKSNKGHQLIILDEKLKVTHDDFDDCTSGNNFLCVRKESRGKKRSKKK